MSRVSREKEKNGKMKIRVNTVYGEVITGISGS